MGYRVLIKPLIGGRVRCRFQPSCSEYSLQAVRHYGIRRGLGLTYVRVRKCTNDVPMCTPDPVP